jgi:hypothetical protein
VLARTRQIPSAAGPVSVFNVWIQLARGQLHAAEATIRTVDAVAAEVGVPGLVGKFLADVAADEMMLGATDAAIRHTDRAVTAASGDRTPWMAPVTYFAAGLPSKAEPLHAALSQRLAGHELYQIYARSMAEAARALARGNPQGALDALQPSEGYLRGNPRLLIWRGRALLALGRPGDATAAFRRALEWKNAAEPSPLGQIARVWLARAQAKTGETAEARRTYEAFFAAWKEADADVPLLAAAQKEYEALLK